MSRHKIIWKLAYLDVEMMSLLQKHKIIRKVAYLGFQVGACANVYISRLHMRCLKRLTGCSVGCEKY